MVFFAGKYCCLLRESNHARPNFDDPAGEGLLEWSGVDSLHSKIQESFEIASGAVIQMLFSSSVDFMGHLSSLKTYFLQERSDWVVDFLESAADLLMKPPDKVKIHSLRVLLQSAIARGGAAASDPYHGCISCNFADSLLQDCLRAKAEGNGGAPSPGNAATRDVPHCIHLLQLEAELQWPLTLVLDAHVIERFNRIFRLIIWMKTCERMLASLWYTNEALSSFAAAYGIKHQLTQFLRQFLFYAAHFVVEPLWSRMVSRVLQTDSVFSITNALNDFFEGVELGLAMASPQRFSSLSHILDLCRRFCELGVHSSTTTAPLIEATLHAIEEDFLRTLSELAAPIGADYTQLVPLLTWIDFSGFYGRNNVYHILRGASHTA
ncbi:unnamed protein product [Phytomonas sp. EM1]|nr:unnamed protein product [Phytomonas sp. EM1]|eukprot:CCW63895.1 unnamed protein product [Phytomonas sp. isolate EM1]